MLFKQVHQIKIFPAHTKAGQEGGGRLVDRAVRIEAEDWGIQSQYGYLALFGPKCAECEEIQESLGACSCDEVLPEVLELVDCFTR